MKRAERLTIGWVSGTEWKRAPAVLATGRLFYLRFFLRFGFGTAPFWMHHAEAASLNRLATCWALFQLPQPFRTRFPLGPLPRPFGQATSLLAPLAEKAQTPRRPAAGPLST